MTYKDFDLRRAAIVGTADNKSMRKACSALGKGWAPACDHSHYSDSHCRVVGGPWHLSHPDHVKSHGMSENFFFNAVMYTGSASRSVHRGLWNLGNTHAWSGNGDKHCHGVKKWNVA